MAFYLKYRPQTIGELDLPEVREVLSGLLKSKSLPHALLFTGVRGTGKTSSARIWAKAVNCEHKDKNGEPCNKCDNCRAITKGNSVDVIEMDAASNRKIDDIRELREKVRLAPTKLKYKVYIIDEVHMLTNEAFNALLKTLEEPPANVLFVLCTTETDKLPDTIVSRCVRVNFRTAGLAEIAASLGRVAKGEKVKIDKEALELLAKLGEGSFRDATKLLEEVAWMEGEISRTRLEEHFHMGQGEMETLEELLNEKNKLGVMEFVEERAAAGRDMKLLASRIVDYLHEQWRLALDGNGSLDYSDGEIRQLIDQIDEYWWRFNTALKAQLPLEIALLNWMDKDEPKSGLEKVSEPNVRKAVKVEVTTAVVSSDTVELQEQVVKVTSNAARSPQGAGSVERVVGAWEDILGAVRARNISVEAFLRAAKPVRLEGDKLFLELAYSFHRDKLLEQENRRLVEDVISKLLEMEVKVECQLNPNGKPQTKTANTVSAPVAAPRSPAPPVPSASSSRGAGGGYRRRTIASQAPVPTEEDEALVAFAEEIFGK